MCIKVEDIEIQSHESDVLSMYVQHQFENFSHLAKRAKDAYKYFMPELDRIYKIAVTKENETPDANEALPNQQDLMLDRDDAAANCTLKDPHISQIKGRKRKDSDKTPSAGRYKSGLEVSLNKTSVKRRACKSCGECGHYQTTCKMST